MKLVIFITTYNERENIEALIHQIFSIPIAPDDQIVKIAVIDDSSTDGTQEILAKLKNQYQDRLHVMIRKERGRGTAAVAGFRYSLTIDCDCIMEMDGDLSHDPKYIPQFLSFIRHYDVVIGSRYVEGGYVRGWPLSRKIISGCANFLYGFVLGTKIHDLSGAYRCYRKWVIEKLDFDHYVSIGYAIAIEMNFKCYKLGCSFIEIPIIFQNRIQGSSKFRFKEAKNALIVIFKLLFRYGRAFRLLDK